jgi:pyruvate dehydrogenase E1 component alpha subunit
MDAIQVYAATAKAAARARNGDGPSLIETVTYRYRSSTFSDAADYDARREEPIWRERDPILNLRARLIAERSMLEERFDEIDREISATIDAAVKFAEQKRASRD